MRKRNQVSAIFIALVITFLIHGTSAAFQEEGGREKISGQTKIKGTRPARPSIDSRAKVHDQKQPPGAALPTALTVTVTPSDSRIWLNDREIDYRAPDGHLRLTGLKPSTLKIAARKLNYRDYERTISLDSQQNNVVNIILVPLPGHISIRPSVNGTAITLTNKDQNISFGPYTENVSNIEVPAGSYQLSVSKAGYIYPIHNVDIEPAATLYLEPQLEPLPVEKPAVRRISAMTLQTFSEGKNIVVSLRGATGDSSGGRGTVEVSVPDGRSGAGTVTGALPGVPCRVDFVRLENIGDYSFSEPPALSNGWARVMIRIRPKDSKRPIRFAINWSSVQESLITEGATKTASLAEDAVPVQKILPNYPPAARSLRTIETVLVKVEIDEQGNVISAKAIEGLNLFRAAAENAARQWKFHPAKRDGRPVKATQTIQFNFNPQL